MPALALAVAIRGPMKRATAKRVRAVLTSGGYFSACETGYRFSRDGTIKASGIYGASGTGTYSIDGTVIEGSGDGAMMMECESKHPKRDCPWSFQMQWEVLRVGDEALEVSVIQDPAEQLSPPEEPVLLVCRSDSYDKKTRCTQASDSNDTAVELIPGNKDRALYDRLREFLKTWDGAVGRHGHAIVFEGRPAKNQRKESEIWFRDDAEDDARALAKKLESVLGPVEPQPWTLEGTFDIYIVVGAHRVGESPVRVALMDGYCVGKEEGCTSPVFEAIRSALPAGQYPLVKQAVAKKARTATEVWYQEGAEAAVRRLVRAHLSEWVSDANIKKWTWGGDFDAMIVAGSPPAD
jgi:hypothetical protein